MFRGESVDIVYHYFGHFPLEGGLMMCEQLDKALAIGLEWEQYHRSWFFTTKEGEYIRLPEFSTGAVGMITLENEMFKSGHLVATGRSANGRYYAWFTTIGETTHMNSETLYMATADTMWEAMALAAHRKLYGKEFIHPLVYCECKYRKDERHDG